MSKRIVILDGHPDPDPGRLCHALAQAYAAGASKAGHEVRRIDLAALSVPLLRTRAEWEGPTDDPAVRRCQDDLHWAQHWVIIYPLWLGAPPAALKGLLEQVLRPGFAIATGARTLSSGLMRGRSARIIVTMGMPGWFYRLWFRALTLRSLDRNILRFVGVAPVRTTVLGLIEGRDHGADLRLMDRLGAAAR